MKKLLDELINLTLQSSDRYQLHAVMKIFNIREDLSNVRANGQQRTVILGSRFFSAPIPPSVMRNFLNLAEDDAAVHENAGNIRVSESMTSFPSVLKACLYRQQGKQCEMRGSVGINYLSLPWNLFKAHHDLQTTLHGEKNFHCDVINM